MPSRKQKRQASAPRGSKRLRKADNDAHVEDLNVANGDTEMKMTSKATTGFQDILRSVIKIYCTHTEPNFGVPWQMKRQDSSTSSGFVIDGDRIMCNAHGIAFHGVVRVRRHGNSKKYIAKVAHVGHECDLAILTVQDPLFWDGLRPLHFGYVPSLQDKINVVGYPTGGDNVSVTQGIVSRVGVGKYSHTDSEALLVVQIDAAINAGNSGGPALKGNEVVGVAFETLDDAENIGYVIPTPVIRHFLQDIEKHGQYRGFCTLGVHWQAIENKGMRSSLKLKTRKDGKANGVLVRKVEALSDSSSVLRANDVIVEFDGHSIASDGTIGYRENERLCFSFLVTSKFVGDQAVLKFLRNGKVMKGKITLTTRKPLVRTHMYDKKTSYFIFGGLVFTHLSLPYLEAEFGKKWDKKAPIKLCDYAFFGIPKTEGEQVVVLNQVLVSDVNVGYEEYSNLKVYTINDKPILNLEQLVETITTNKQKFLKVRLEQDHLIVIDTKHARDSHQSILDQNNIPSDISEDLKVFVKKKKNLKK